MLDRMMPAYYERHESRASPGINTYSRDESYIVSLTSFPERINEVWITIETLMRQTFKPDMIILWLAEEQFPDKKVPESLNKLTSRGLTIKFCEDLRAHKKYYFSLINYPTSNIITVDDDLYYPRNLLFNLVKLHSEFPDLIVTNRAHRITFSGKELNPYRQWKHNVTDTQPSYLLLATGGAGTLYPPDCLHNDVFKKELLRKLCFYADDLWLKIMSLRRDKKIATNKMYNKDFASVGKSQRTKLVSVNVLQGGNDEQLNNLLTYFGTDFLMKHC
ncbi:MAG: glycosyl transferase [Bacteroidales bacterium]